MPKVKISEYSATANSNTDVASINIDEGCAPSGINNAIRAVMGHLKDFQSGTYGDPFNGPVNGTLGATTASTANVTTLTTSSTVTHNGGTANGVAYLNGSKVLTTGSALTFNGSALAVTGAVNATASSGSVSTLRQNSATGYGLTIIPGADTVYDAFTINNAADSLNKIRMYGNGTAYFAGNLSVGGATPTTSGTGITFPATDSPSSNANTLDDYEEGTWTPDDQSGASLSFTIYNATYTKVGRLVQIQASITYPSTASILDAQIGGLPFNSASGTDNTSGICLVGTNVNLNFTGLIARNNTKFFLETTSGASISNVNMSSKYIKFFGWYIV